MFVWFSVIIVVIVLFGAISFVVVIGSQMPSTYDLTATAIIKCPLEKIWDGIYQPQSLFRLPPPHLEPEIDETVVNGKKTCRVWSWFGGGENSSPHKKTLGWVSIQSERQYEFLVREIKQPGGGLSVHSVRLIRDAAGCKVVCHQKGDLGNGFVSILTKACCKFFGVQKQRPAEHYLQSVASSCASEIQFLDTSGTMYGIPLTQQ